MRLIAKAILFERWTSIQIQNIITAVNEMNKELTNNPIVTTGEAEKITAA
jgi:hypothetical protein